jgi:hypothetical protein
LLTWKWSSIRKGVRFLSVMDPMLRRTSAPAPCKFLINLCFRPLKHAHPNLRGLDSQDFFRNGAGNRGKRHMLVRG